VEAASAFLDRRVPMVLALRPHLLDETSPLVTRLINTYDNVVPCAGGRRGPIRPGSPRCGRSETRRTFVRTPHSLRSRSYRRAYSEASDRPASPADQSTKNLRRCR
jgi:hypothetical protein